MKIKYLFTGVLISMLAFMSCEDPDDLARTGSENVTGLTITGCLASDESTTYSAIVDEASNTITIQVPYYISDTEKIQGDLTQMKVSASLPVGAKFSPSISGIRDLVSGFQSTLVKEDGSKITYTFKADYVKSDQSSISKVQLTDFKATIRIIEPKTAGDKGEIVIYKTSSAIDAAIKSANLTISPWATIESSGWNPTSQILDLSQQPEVTIIAQNGINKTIYETKIQYPEILPQGVGYISSLFGFQTYQDDTHGFEATANRSLAVVDDYLIVSNSIDASKMIVFNRFNGNATEKTVNTTGITRSIHANANDDANHLVAVPYTHSTNTEPSFEIWVWKNGIENEPEKIFSKDITTDSYFASLRNINSTTTNYDIGRTLSVKGDVTSGDALVGTMCYQKFRPVIIPLTNGKPSTEIQFIEFRTGCTVSTGVDSKVTLMNTDKTHPTYAFSMHNYRGINYAPANGANGYPFTIPGSHWWSEQWNSDVKGMDYIEFNGVNLLAIQNGRYTGNPQIDAFNRLYVANITSPSQTALTNGFIFDSREGNSTGTGSIPGSGYAVTGMTSYASFISGKTVLGSNPNKTGDVCFAASSDGNAVQVYMLTTDHGILAYELTRFNM